MQHVTETAKRLLGNVEQVIVGKRQPLILALVSWFAEGHILLEDVPGVAKTMLARAFAGSVGGTFRRIQCTPDLLPTDITGSSVFNQKSVEFEFRSGPVFSHILLADEINRATPRTQAALLEAMAESSVSVDGTTYPLAKPFLVIATQNPVDHEGTFPLPEAQLDRFLMRFSIGYPAFDDELQILDRLQNSHPIERLQPVITPDDLRQCQHDIRGVHVDTKIRRYITEIVHNTRKHEEIRLGGSPRATVALFRTSQALAAIRGRAFVTPDDVKRVSGPVLNHRMILKPEARLRKVQADQIVADIVADVPVPIMS